MPPSDRAQSSRHVPIIDLGIDRQPAGSPSAASHALRGERAWRRLPLEFLLALVFGFPLFVQGQQPLPVPAELQNPQTTISVSADHQGIVKNKWELRGNVTVTYQQFKLTADEASYDDSSGEIAAGGHVRFVDSTAELEADETHYNVQTQKGWFSNARGRFYPKVRTRPRLLLTEDPFHVQARRVERLDEDTYLLEDVHFSSCEAEARGWSVSSPRATVYVGEKVVSHGALFKLAGLPLFYSPFLINSIAPRRRQTGFLLPNVGHSSQKGLIVGDGFYWAINPSADLLLGFENYSVRGPAGRAQFHARPSSSSEIAVDYFGVDDRGGGALRQFRAPGNSLRATGQARDLGSGFRGVMDVDYASSLAFRETFGDNFTQAVNSETYQRGFLTKSFDAYSLNFYVSRYQNFLSTQRTPGNSIIIRQAPSASFSGTDKQVGQTPFYFAVDASAGGVGRTEPGFQTPTLSKRFDFHPTLTLRTRPFWGFHFTPSAGVRATHYGTSLLPGGDPINRLLGEVSVDLRPPSFAKVFSPTHGGRRFKHVIEPDIRYRLVRARDPEHILGIIRFDETDIVTETNEIEYSLTNSILTRKDPSEGGGEASQARELISWRLSQKYYFDPTFGGALQPGKNVVFGPTISLTGFAFAQGHRLSPLVSVLKLAPSSNYDTELRADFNPSGGGVLNAGITSRLKRGPFGLAFTDFYINKTASLLTPLPPTANLSALPSFNLLRTVASYGDVNRSGFSGAFGIDYNFAQGIVNQAVSQVGYNFRCGCFGLAFEYRRFALGPLRQENSFRMAITLTNIGTFGNLKRRERLF